MFNGLQLKSRYIAVDCASNWVKLNSFKSLLFNQTRSNSSWLLEVALPNSFNKYANMTPPPCPLANIDSFFRARIIYSYGGPPGLILGVGLMLERKGLQWVCN